MTRGMGPQVIRCTWDRGTFSRRTEPAGRTQAQGGVPPCYSERGSMTEGEMGDQSLWYPKGESTRLLKGKDTLGQARHRRGTVARPLR